MSSNNKNKEEIKKYKLIRCNNCRQDIEEKKMFLHEGFCLRNNIFCKHCEKVFLKKDYKKHIINLPKNLTTKKEKHLSKSKKSTSNEEKNHKPIIKTITTINQNSSVEYVLLPLEEEYTINTPIIISENGQILSYKNKNEYLFPFLGVHTIQNNDKYYSTENTNYNNNFYINNKNTYTMGINNQINKNNNLKNENYLNDNNYQYNYNNNKLDTFKHKCNYSINDNFNKTFEANSENNNIYININGKKMTFNNNEKKYIFNNYLKNTKNLFEKNTKKFLENKKLNSIISSKKEPKDSKSKKKSNQKKYNEKLYKKNFNIYKTYNADINEKKLIKKKLCVYCNKYFKDLYFHHKICKSKQLFQKIENNDNIIFTERLRNQNIDEFGIEDIKKQILHREFISSFHEFNKISNLGNKLNRNQNYRRPTKIVFLRNFQNFPIKKKLEPQKEERSYRDTNLKKKYSPSSSPKSIIKKIYIN